MVTIAIYLLMANKLLTLRAKNSESIKYPMCLGGLSKGYDKNCRKETGLYGNVYDFSVDYNAIKVDDILDVHKYLMKKSNIT